MNGQGACSLLLQLRPTSRRWRKIASVGSRTSDKITAPSRGNVAHRRSDRWEVEAVGAPNIGERSEKATLTCSLRKS